MRRVVGAVIDFVVGDDALVAAGVAVALALAWAGVRLFDADPWWLLALAVPAVLAGSLRRAVRG